MLKLVFPRLAICLLMAVTLFAAGSEINADDPVFQHPDTDWMTWTLTDAAGDNIDLSSYENGYTYVVLFSASDTDSCDMMRDLATHIRANPNKADTVLATCIDDTGHKALKQYIRQEEWTKRVAAWEATQEAARVTAEAAGEEYTPEAMPDILKDIKDELADEDDLATLMTHHFPFNTSCRCEQMWDWLSERMDSPSKAPRVLKFNSNGKETNEWTALPSSLGG